MDPGKLRVFELDEVVVKRQKGDCSFTLHVPQLHIQAGEFVGVVGDSGCGKSTLLDVLGLILPPYSARAFRFRASDGTCFDLHPGAKERDLAAIRRTQLGYVLQTGGLLPFLSVRKNIELSRRLNGLVGNRKAARQLAEVLGIQSQLNKHPQHLSGGQRQRAAIARALAHEPPVVLADEPTAAVDGHTAREILTHLRMLTRRMGVTLIMVTHDLRLVEKAADRLLTFDLWQAEDGIQSRCHGAYQIR